MDLLQNLHDSIINSLANQQLLLVLDDVWDEKFAKWRRLRICLQNGGDGSTGCTVLVTTRSEQVARVMGTKETNLIKPNLISDSDCWSLMSQIAFCEKDEEESDKLVGIGKQIAKKCKGLPLAARTLGGLLFLKSTEEEWKQVLESEIWKLQDVEQVLFVHLLLSYHELPPTVRRCFSYLALFPKDSFVTDDQLITLWMAHGYLEPRRSEVGMMQAGREYFKYLVSRALFEESIPDWQGKREASMHDIMHDFALHLVGCEFLSIEQENENNTGSDFAPTKRSYPKSTKVRHLSVRGNINPIAICDVGKLRSCLIIGLPQNVIIDLVQQLKVVRALYLKYCNLEQVPQEIGKLMHLRTLDLSHNPFHELPETIGELYNLQCLWLEELVNLSSFPKQIGRLVNLQELRGPDFETGSCNLGLFKYLNQLGGVLRINFTNAPTDEVDAEEAELGQKRYLTELVLNFNHHKVPENVLEALRAPPNLQCLHISDFSGSRLPRWISFLNDLTKLRVHGAIQVLYVPPLGELKSLKELVLNGLWSLEYIGREFLGIESTKRMFNKFDCFPQLKELHIDSCSKLTGWHDLLIPEDENIVVMPKIHILEIRDCPEFVELPLRLLRKLLSLKELHIPSCGPTFTLASEDEEQPHLECLSISNCRGPKLSNWILSLNYLIKLNIDSAEDVLSLPPLGILPSLEELRFESFSVLEFIGREFLGIGNNESKDSFVAFPKLMKFELWNLKKLKEWEDIKPEDEDMSVMPKLEVLSIIFCSELRVFPRRLLCKAARLKELSFVKNSDSSTESLRNDGELLLHIKKVYVNGDLLLSQKV